MPWDAMSTQDLRFEFVSEASREGTNVRQLCRRFNISPKTGYKWLERFRAAASQRSPTAVDARCLARGAARPGARLRPWRCARRIRPGAGAKSTGC